MGAAAGAPRSPLYYILTLVTLGQEGKDTAHTAATSVPGARPPLASDTVTFTQRATEGRTRLIPKARHFADGLPNIH